MKGEDIVQVSAIRYLGWNISDDGMDVDLGENIAKYNKLNGCFQRNFGRNMRMAIKRRLYNTVSKPSVVSRRSLDGYASVDRAEVC
jgi:hypothetical protein